MIDLQRKPTIQRPSSLLRLTEAASMICLPDGSAVASPCKTGAKKSAAFQHSHCSIVSQVSCCRSTSRMVEVNALSTETKREKFVRIAENRTNAVIQRVRTLAKCANPYAYEFTEDDVRKIFGAIEQELKAARVRFSQHDGPTQFRLRERD